MIKSRKVKSVAVTGATSGIGLGAALAFAETGVLLIGVGRDQQRCDQIEAEIQNRFPNATVKYLVANLALQAQVRQLSQTVRSVLQDLGVNHLDALVNNAGIYSSEYILTDDGIELTLAVNHLAPFILTAKLLPLLSCAEHGRVVTVSSNSHYNTRINFKRINKPLIYIGIWAYKVSKLANILFSVEFNRRYQNTNMRAFAVDPGLVNTEIGMKATKGITYRFWDTWRRKGYSIDVPAKTIQFLCIEDSVQDLDDVYWRDCHPKKPSRLALDGIISRKLWMVSNELCQTG